MKRQKFDVGDLVEFEEGRERRRQGLILERKAINPNFRNIDRDYHVDEYTCKVKFIDTDLEEPKWVRAKWLKLLSQAKE